jgi:signal transduction histidine kinase
MSLQTKSRYSYATTTLQEATATQLVERDLDMPELPGLVRRCKRLASRTGGPISIHVSSRKEEVDPCIVIIEPTERISSTATRSRPQDAINELQGAANRYENALRDYRTLMDHRVRNPLAIIRGVTLTLCESPALAPDIARQLYEELASASERLENVILDPRMSSEEASLMPRLRSVPQS